MASAARLGRRDHETLVRRAERAGQSLQRYLAGQLAATAATPKGRLSPKDAIDSIDAERARRRRVGAGADGATIRARLRGETIAGPDLLRIEVLAVIRKRIDRSLTDDQADAAVDDLLDLPLSVFPAAPLLRRAWTLRDNLTAYDACYIALAEALDCPLLTADARIANAPGNSCAVELI